MPSKAIYVSSKLKHRDRWLASGLPIVSTWIHGEELPPSECSAMWDRYRDEVRASDAFVLYAEPDDHLKGCILEMGIAFSLGRPIVIVWAGTIEALAAKIGTIVYHRSVTVVPTTEQAVAMLMENGRATDVRQAKAVGTGLAPAAPEFEDDDLVLVPDGSVCIVRGSYKVFGRLVYSIQHPTESTPSPLGAKHLLLVGRLAKGQTLHEVQHLADGKTPPR